MTPPSRIAALTAQAIAGALSAPNWERTMQRVIAQGHTAAAIAGTAERLGAREGSALLNSRNLSRAERQAIQERVAGQLPYLRQFAADVRSGALSEAQIAARAALYAGATRATYSEARWYGAGLPAHPADGSSECLVNCRCAWVERGGAMYWEMGSAEHCPTCESRSSQWNPWRGK